MKSSRKRLLLILSLLILLTTPTLARAFSCHSYCEDAMMEFFERCIEQGGGYPCTNEAHAFFCGCMAGCDPTHPATECN